MKTQKQIILELLQKRGDKGVSCYEFAMKLGILRYGAHIHSLRKEGYRIEMEDKRVKKNGMIQRHTKYFLINKNKKGKKSVKSVKKK